MSQIYKPLTNTGPIPGVIITSVTTDVANATTTGPGTIKTLNNNISLLGSTSIFNNNNGIQTDANPNNASVGYIELTNRATGSITTVGASSGIAITLPLGSIVGGNAVFTFDIVVAGLATAGAGFPLGCGFTIVGSVRTSGGVAVLVPNQAVDHFEENLLTGVESNLNVGANNALVTVTGIAGYTINWNATLTYVVVT